MTLLCLGVPFNESTQKTCTKREDASSPVHTLQSGLTRHKRQRPTFQHSSSACCCSLCLHETTKIRFETYPPVIEKRIPERQQKTSGLFVHGKNNNKRMLLEQLGTYRGQQCCSHALYHTLQQLCLFTARSVYKQPRAFLVDSLNMYTVTHTYRHMYTRHHKSDFFRKGEIRSTSFTRESFSQVLGLQ